MRIGIDVRSGDPVQPGQQRYLWRLGAWLDARGHDVHFLSVRRQPPDVALPGAATLHRYAGVSRAELRRRVAALQLDVLLLNPERSRRYRGVHANLLRSGYGTEHYSQKLRSFRNPAELALRRALRLAPWVAAERRWERAFYEAPRPAPDVIAQSEYMRRQILSSYRIPGDHVHVVYNGVDLTEFSPAHRRALRGEARSRWAVPDDAFCLVFLGHNFRLKGLWQLLRVLSRLQEATESLHLLVVGRGTGQGQRRKAARLVRRYGLDGCVTVTGLVDSSVEALAAADALVHLSWHDSFGFVALEAMACGLPVVTTRYAGAAELIDDGRSGLLVDPARDDELARALVTLADPGTRERLGSAAAAVAAEHGETRSYDEILAVMELARARAQGTVAD